MYILVIFCALLAVLAILLRRQIKFIFYLIYIFYLSLMYAFFTMKKENIHSWWTSHTSRVLGAKFSLHPDSKQINKAEKTMILCNHTTMADFFTHDVVTEHTCNFLSRMLVGILFPFTYLTTQKHNTVWYFVRGGRGSDLEKFFQWVDACWAYNLNIRNNLLVYPEGHRNFDRNKPLPLKKGMIRYAFERGVKVQIVISFGNERLFNEKNFAMAPKTGGDIISYVDDVVDPKQFKSEPEFFDFISKRFFEKFFAIYDYKEGKKTN